MIKNIAIALIFFLVGVTVGFILFVMFYMNDRF